MKKTIIFLIVAIFIVSFTIIGIGCKKEEAAGTTAAETTAAPAEKVTITFANWVSSEEAFREKLLAAIADFEKNNPNVKVENLPIPYDQYREQLLTMTAGGNAPDVFVLSQTWIAEFAGANELLEVESYLDKDFLADMLDAAKAVGMFNGKMYGVSDGLLPHVIWYNKELMQKAGIDSYPTTITDLKAACAKVKENLGPDVYPLGLDVTLSDFAGFSTYNWLLDFGVNPFQEEFDNPRTVEAFKWFRENYAAGYIPDVQIKELRELFAEDKIVFQFDGPYLGIILPSLNADFKDSEALYNKFGAARMPYAEGVDWGGMATGNVMSVSNKIDDAAKKAAVSFAEFYVKQAYGIDLWAILPLKQQLEVEHKDFYSTPIMSEIMQTVVPYMKGFTYLEKDAELSNAIKLGIQEACLTDKPIEEIVTETAKKLNDILGQ